MAGHGQPEQLARALPAFSDSFLVSTRMLLALELRVSDKAIFNARWGLTKFPGVYRAQRDTALVNEILMSVGLSAEPPALGGQFFSTLM